MLRRSWFWRYAAQYFPVIPAAWVGFRPGGKGGKGERIGDACEILNEPNELQEEIGERMLTVKRPCQIVHFAMPQHFLPR